MIDRNLVALRYDDRLAALLEARIGLWDVVATAARAGSSDAAIRDHTANDLATLLARLPDQRAIAFNGQKALAIGRPLIAGRPVPIVALPSSSALHTIGFDGKRPAWLALKGYIMD